jgi:hypothetical protein
MKQLAFIAWLFALLLRSRASADGSLVAYVT